jgi:hypothetical protein
LIPTSLGTFGTANASNNSITEATGHHSDTEPSQAEKKGRRGITARTSEDSKKHPKFRFNGRGTTTQTVLVQNLKY